MTRETDRRAFELFDEVCDLDEPARRAMLDERCAGDHDLRAAVERLLSQDVAHDDDFLPGEGAELIAAQVSEDLTAAAPSQIGRYRVIREVGRGGMGVVYEAEQEEPRRRVAVKVIRDGVVSPEMLRRFRRESQLLGRLQHPGVAHVYDAGVDRATRRPYYAMEFIEGLPIDLHADEHRLGVQARAELIARVCDAVDHAHQKGILHRDIKAANVLVSAVVGDAGDHSTIDSIGQPKVVDFGIARLTDDTEAVTQQTHAGQVLGSIACMSPEQLSGDRESVDTRSDVYAIGVLLYRLLAGRSPHDLTGLSIPEAARVVAESEPRTLGAADGALRGDLSVIAAKALERDPDRRYGSVAALGEDLRRTLRDEPIEARPASRWYLARKFARRNRTLVSAASVGLVLLIAASVVSGLFAIAADRARRDAEEHALLADRAAYRASLSAVAAAIRDGDTRLARVFLAEAPQELRGWEWRHLEQSLDQSVGVGPREIVWQGDSAKFASGACWLSDGGRVLHAPLARGTWRTFESFDAESLRPRASWRAVSAESCAGRVGDGELLFYDADTGDLVVRDLHTGGERRRHPSGIVAERLVESFDQLPLDPEELLETLRARALPGPGRAFGSVSPSGDVWISWRGAVLGTVPLRAGVHGLDLGSMGEGAACATFSPSGDRIALTRLDRRLQVYDAATGQLVWGRAEVHDDAPMCVAFSPDGTVLATGGQDSVIKLWDARTGNPRGQLIGHNGTVVAIGFDFSGQRLFTSDGAEVRAWRVSDASDPGVIARHGSFVHDLSINQDGSLLVSRVATRNTFGAPTREVKISDPRSGTVGDPLALPDETEAILHVDFLDPERVGVLIQLPADEAGAHVYSLYEFEAPSGRTLGSQSLDAGVVASWAEAVARIGWGVRPTLNDLAAGRVPDPDGTWVRRFPPHEWTDSDGSVRWRIDATDHRCISFAADPESDRLYAGTIGGEVLVFDTATGELVTALDASEDGVNCLALTPDGSRLFSGSGDTTIRVWDTSRLELVAVLRGHRDTVRVLVVAPDSQTLYSASDDYTVRAWATQRPVIGASE